MRPSFRTTNSVETLNTYDIKIEKIAYFYFLNNLFAERADFAWYCQRRVTRTLEPVRKVKETYTMRAQRKQKSYTYMYIYCTQL